MVRRTAAGSRLRLYGLSQPTTIGEHLDVRIDFGDDVGIAPGASSSRYLKTPPAVSTSLRPRPPANRVPRISRASSDQLRVCSLRSMAAKGRLLVALSSMGSGCESGAGDEVWAQHLAFLQYEDGEQLSMADKMTACGLCFPAPYELTYERYPLNYGAGEVVVRTHYSLISPGTELALFMGTHSEIRNPDDHFAKYPFYPGYASVGTVITGTGEESGLKEGDRVFLMSTHASLSASSWNERQDRPILRIPDELPDKHAMFASLAAVSMTAVLRAHATVGSTVVVIGMGLIGNLAAQLFALSGAYVMGVDVSERRLSLAKEAGIKQTTVVDAEQDFALNLVDSMNGRPIDVVIEATGNPTVIRSALNAVRPSGQVILLGTPRGNVEIDAYESVHRKGATLTGAHASTHGVNGMPNKLAITSYCMDLLASGALCVSPLLTHVCSAKAARDAYELLMSTETGALGVGLRWDDDTEGSPVQAEGDWNATS